MALNCLFYVGMCMSVFDFNPHTASVSVVIPCYCCEDTIRRAVASVYKQTLRPLEVILVDDCSPDQTLKLLKAIQAEYSEGWIKIVEITLNRGPGNARNIGWASALGSYVAFLDADDSWHSCKTEYQYSWMQKNINAALTGQQSVLSDTLDNDSGFGGGRGKVNFKLVDKGQLLLSNRFSTSSVMIKAGLPYRFTDSRNYSEDYEMWCDVAFDEGACFVMSPEFTYTHKALFGVSGLSSDLWKMERGELLVFEKLYRRRKVGLASYILYSSWSLVRYFRRCIKVQLAGS
mgnify:CR=1 FL=1